MSSSARLGGSICKTGAALWRWRTDFVAGAVFSASGRVFAWQRQLFERAARGLNLRDRRSTLEMACKFRGRRSFFCIWVCVCVAGAAFGSCLRDWMLSSARLGGSICVTGAALWKWLANFVAGAEISASGCVFAWQGQHVAAV